MFVVRFAAAEAICGCLYICTKVQWNSASHAHDYGMCVAAHIIKAMPLSRYCMPSCICKVSRQGMHSCIH